MSVICHACEMGWVGDGHRNFPEEVAREQRPDDRLEVVKLEKKKLVCKNS